MLNKPIKGANLKLALQQNNKKFKDFISERTNKLDQISIAQKTVNTELDSCFCKVINAYTPVAGEYIPFEKISGSFDVKDGRVIVKPGQRVQIDFTVMYYNSVNNPSNIAYLIKDYTNDIKITWLEPYRGDNFFECGYSQVCQYTNNTDKDCEIGIYISAVPGLDTFHPDAVSMTVQEINRQIVIDPLEHVNESQGIEDTPVGHIISHMGTTAPAHYLVCDGTEYNITDYPYLVQHMIDNFGSVNYFGGDGINTFAVPDLRERFLKGSDIAGASEEAGLPNITGGGPNTFYWGGRTAYSNGAITTKAITNDASIDSTVSDSTTTQRFRNRGTIFDASQSNAIYGNSDTVTPTNMSVLYCIKYEPTYYMNTYNTNYIQPSLYSLEEKVVGCWINGKPLYQKTVNQITMPQVITDGIPVTKTLDISELKCDLITQIDGFVKYDTVLVPINAENCSEKETFVFCSNSTTLSIRHNHVSWNHGVLCITIQYTKVTDEPNSFTDSMLKESFIKIESTCTEEELQQAISDIVAEIDKEEVIEEPIMDETNMPAVIPEIYEEDTPTVIPEIIPDEEPEQTEPEEVTPEVTEEPETEQTEVTEGGTDNESE